MSNTISKKRIIELATDDDAKYLVFPVDTFSSEQIAALQEARSNLLPPQFRCLSSILEKLLNVYEEGTKQIPPHMRPPKFRAATDYKTVRGAAESVGVKYDPLSNDSKLVLTRTDTETKPLDAGYTTVIDDLYRTNYINWDGNDGISRTMLDLIILDRVNKLQDQESYKHLRLNAEVPLTIKTTDAYDRPMTIRGRADWALGWSTENSDIDALLLAVEAKSSLHASSTGLAQMTIYLAAVHAAKEAAKINRTVFGMVSDAGSYWFACLDDSKNLSISEPMVWNYHKDKILAYLDAILQKAIESSPRPIPSRHQNATTTLYNHSDYLRSSWQFEGEEEAEAEEETWDDFGDEPVFSLT